MSRPSIPEYMMQLALVAATRTTCIRRGVGCVLTNISNDVLAVTYNGVAPGQEHCKGGKPCIGHKLPPGQDSCEAVHAEINALVRCTRVNELHTAYVTLSPCMSCAKALLATPCQTIVFLEDHPRSAEAKALWLRNGRVWIKLGACDESV
jgi:dCMP deaminase